METCGEYELDRAIGWGRRSTFFSARAIDDVGPALIVVRRARTVERNQRHAFLRAAAEQQTAVAAGCRKLAPILAFDCDAAGFAFYATTRFETSLAEFLEAECKVDSALLREIVTSILGALAELQEKSRRAHGNLTPGNILLDPQGRIFLTDLAPSAKDATAADDLFALGALIYQLIRRTARVGTLNPPLDYSPAWTESVGDDAEGWLAFTNRLLNKPENSSPDAIQSALRDLKSLAGLAAKAAKAAAIISPLESGATTAQAAVRRPPPKKKKTPILAVIAILLLLGGGIGGYVFWKKSETEKTISKILAPTLVKYPEARLLIPQDLWRWKKEKAEEKLQEIRRKFEEVDALPGALKDLVANLGEKLSPAIENSQGVPRLLQRMKDDVKGATSAESAVAQVNLLIRNWDLPDKMKAQAVVWGEAPREWTRLAGELQSAANVNAGGEVSLIVQFENAIATHDAAVNLDIEWDSITRTLGDHKAAGNRRLPDFTPWAENEVRNARDLKDAVTRAKAAATTLDEVRKFQSGLGARVLWDRFEKEVPELLQVPDGALMPVWPTKWMSEAKRRVAPEAGKREEWEKKLAEFGKLIDRLTAKDPSQAEWKRKLAESRAAVDQAMDTDVAKIDAELATKFNTLEPPSEKAHKLYEKILADWKLKVEAINVDDVGAKKQAEALVASFTDETNKLLKDYPEYRASLGNSKLLADKMGEALKTPDKLNLRFSAEGWTDATPQGFDKSGAVYQYKKAVNFYFMALDKEFAMAAWETPLVLARLSGFKAATPLPRDPVTDLQTNGPQTRKDDFTPAVTWLWKGPQDLTTNYGRTRKGPRVYLHPDVVAGDSTAFLPVTWLTFDDAREMARTLGGQLPTVEQWRSAYSRKLAGPEKRLRSEAAWSKQNGLLKDWLAQTDDRFLVNAGRPDLGSFSTQLKESESDKGAAGGTDNKLWLTSVATSIDWTVAKGFTHLVGNAAEWVSDNNKPAVIGASVVSPKIPVDTAFPMSSSAAYFDVTFRLVVPLGPGGAGVGLQEFKKYANEIQPPPKPTR